MNITFEKPVEPGFGIKISGQLYKAIGPVKHTTMAGSIIDLVEWTALCWDCEAPFACRARPDELPNSRRCKGCASPGKKVRRKQ